MNLLKDIVFSLSKNFLSNLYRYLVASMRLSIKLKATIVITSLSIKVSSFKRILHIEMPNQWH